VLLPDRDQRQRVAMTDWSKQDSAAASAIDFYNQATYEAIYARAEQSNEQADIERWLGQSALKGPTLEIGSGRGGLQGIGQDYVALDYSFTALRKHIDPKFQRVCGTADRLPFFDNTFGFIFTVTALEHVPAADAAFEEIHRVLKGGGIAYLAPAWHCVQWICDGVRVRTYRELDLGQKWAKLTLPIRTQPAAKAMATLPRRLLRRATWSITGGRTQFRFTRLRAEYSHFWESDCDACSRLDSHEACLFFQSRGYDVMQPGAGALRQVLARHGAVVVRKP
jgi:SAM-dependent methyltransferase